MKESRTFLFQDLCFPFPFVFLTVVSLWKTQGKMARCLNIVWPIKAVKSFKSFLLNRAGNSGRFLLLILLWREARKVSKHYFLIIFSFFSSDCDLFTFCLMLRLCDVIVKFEVPPKIMSISTPPQSPIWLFIEFFTLYSFHGKAKKI